VNGRIFVVDDEAEIAEMVVECLRDRGHEAVFFTHPQDCLDELAINGAQLVVSDINMPDIDGLEFIKRAKAICPNLPAIIITGYARLDYAISALRQGVDDFFLKPFNIDDLLKVIEQNLGRNTEITSDDNQVSALQNANSKLARQRSLLEKRFHQTRSDLNSINRSLSKASDALGTLSDLSGKLICENNLENLLTLCLDLIAERMSVRNSFILLKEGQCLAVKASRPDSLWKEGPLSIDEGFGRMVASSEEPIIVSDGGKLERLPCKALGNSFISVPMFFNQQLLGALIVSGDDNGNVPSEQELSVLTVIARQMGMAVSNVNLHRALKLSAVSAVESLVVSLEVKDPYTCGHSNRVTLYASEMAIMAGRSPEEIECIKHAGLLHDIGKIGIPERILIKPDKLTDEEFNEIKVHPAIGERIAGTLDFLGSTKPIIRHHHERWDGKGYPDGLREDEIPPLAALIAVADVYDAMTSERAYRPALNLEKAFYELRQGSGKQFSADAVALFFDTYNRLPHPNDIPLKRPIVFA